MNAKHQPHPLNAPGPFYVTNHECITCMLPMSEAPDLMGFVGEGEHHCYFKKQPSTPDEVERAIAAISVNCCGAVRYGGADVAIIQRLRSLRSADNCDYKPKRWWEFWRVQA